MTQATQSQYEALFPNLDEAVEFEDSVLNSDPTFLPQCAVRVLLDNDDHTPTYWAWLIGQAQDQPCADLDEDIDAEGWDVHGPTEEEYDLGQWL